MQELKSCPFCGGDAKAENNDRIIYDPKTFGFVDVEYGEPQIFWVKCEECEAFVGGFDTEEGAITAWNRRAVVRAEWIEVTVPKKWGGTTTICSNCRKTPNDRSPFCPNCGASMKGGA